MSTTYDAARGDTFDDIARRVYGSEQYAWLIAAANPGLSNPVPSPTSITVPPLNESPLPVATPSSNANEVSVLIDGEVFRFWTAVSITRALDAMSTAEFSAPFEPDDAKFRQTFRPFRYAPVVISVGGAVLFSGTMLTATPEVGPDSRTVTASCYSRAAVLNDCGAPASAFPVEFNGQTLQGVAATLCRPFGIEVVFGAPPGASFERVSLEPSSTVLSLLADLAKQRSLVIRDTPGGAVEFPAVASPGSPVAYLREGEPPLVSVSPQFAAQDYYSHVTGLEPVTVGGSGGAYTVRNERLSGVLRPHNFTGRDVEGGDIKIATQAKIGRMFRNMVTYTVTLATWRDPDGRLWEPNTTVSLFAPGAMVYQPYELLVRQVTLDKNEDSEVATLELVLPGSFSGQVPEVLPWQE